MIKRNIKNYELSRIRTYIRNLEGFCPNPLDDEPVNFYIYNCNIKNYILQDYSLNINFCSISLTRILSLLFLQLLLFHTLEQRLFHTLEHRRK